MLDAVTIERRGLPTATVGVDKLVMTTGRGMARAQGFPDLAIAAIEHISGSLEGVHDPKEIDRMAQQAAGQVEKILTGK